MREIKFRAWDKNTKIMIHWDDLVKSRISFRNFRWALLSENSENFELMQYTGLKDKNGVEIYEGDILSYFGFEYEVTFEESAFGWSEDGQFYAFAEMAIDEIEKTKIIGNIYETQSWQNND